MDWSPRLCLSAAALSVIDTPSAAKGKIETKTSKLGQQTNNRPSYEREDSVDSVNLTRYSVDIIAPDAVPLELTMRTDNSDDVSDVIIWDDPDEAIDAEQLTLPQHHQDYDYDKKETKSTGSISSASDNDDQEDEHEEYQAAVRHQVVEIDGGDVYVCRPSLTSKDLVVDFGLNRGSFCSIQHSTTSSLSASVHRCHNDPQVFNERQEENLIHAIGAVDVSDRTNKSVQFASRPQVHAVQSFVRTNTDGTVDVPTNLWYTESDLDAFQRQKDKDIAMIKVLQRFSGLGGSRRGSMESFSSGSRRASVESAPSGTSSRRGSMESTNRRGSMESTDYDPMAQYAKMRLEKANTTPIGLENHVCSKMSIGEMNQRREEHCRAVLGEQKRQRSLVQQEKKGTTMIEKLLKTNKSTAADATDDQVERIAEISSTYSELSRRRAEVNGTLHAENDCCKIIRAGRRMSSARRLSLGEVSGGPSLPTPPSA